MGWDDIEVKLGKMFSNNYVSCNGPEEIAAIKTLIKEEFPNLSDADIEAGIGKCNEEVPEPKPVKDFLKCLIATLDF